MKFSHPIAISELAKQYQLNIIGDERLMATGINEIHKVCPGDITFVDAEKYYQKSIQSEASIILINKTELCPEGKALLICDNPFEVYNSIVLQHRPILPQVEGVSPTAYIHSTATIEQGVFVGHYAVIGPHCHIHANAYIGEYSVLGSEVVIHAAAVIGSDAFYYKKTAKGFIPWRSCGRTIIHDRVTIGAGTTVNKGVSGDTIIHEGTKIDCQVHIGHGVVIGKNCLFAAQVGIGGKTVVGNNVTMYGQVGVAQNLVIADNIVLLAKSGVSKNLTKPQTYYGVPAEEVRSKYKELATLRQLPKMMKGK